MLKEKAKGDIKNYSKKVIKENPNVKVILTNILSTPAMIFVNPSYYKVIFQNRDKFEKYNHSLHPQLMDKGIAFSPVIKWK